MKSKAFLEPVKSITVEFLEVLGFGILNTLKTSSSSSVSFFLLNSSIFSSRELLTTGLLSKN
jgi:hypothetical protein